MDVNPEQDIIIIDDSKAICKHLRDMFEGFGYLKIHECYDGNSGLELFKSMISSGKKPFVFLDYVLPDIHGKAVFTQMISLDPESKIVLETVKEKDDQDVQHMIASGVFGYIPKPIRFEDVKQAVNQFENEMSFIKKEEDTIKLLLEEEKKITDNISHLIEASSQISLERIAEYCKITTSGAKQILEKMISEKKILCIGEIEEIACNQCNSIKIATLFLCPACKQSNFQLKTLIEHYACANFAPEKDYVDNICPKCRKELKTLGNDYQLVEEYLCNNCNDVFPRLKIRFLCLKCNNHFSMENGSWKKNLTYKRT